MKTAPLKGMRDTLPNEEALRTWLLNTILNVYRENGFFKISTPIIEDGENISHSDGGDNLNLVFHVLKRGEKLSAALEGLSKDETQDEVQNTLCDMALRYDLTLPLVRYYSEHKAALPSPFKAIQADQVFRAERPQKGRLRQFTQCDIDILGDSSTDCEIELLYVTSKALMAVGFKNFTININDRRLLKAALLNCGFEPDTLDAVAITFDKLDKIGSSGVCEELRVKSLPPKAIDKFALMIKKIEDTNKTPKTNEDLLSSFGSESETADIRRVISAAKGLSCGNFSIRFNPSLVRGQGYYTGLVFEVTVEGSKSAIAGGGRYDHMVEKFTGKPTPAAGFSIGFERIYSILEGDKNFSFPSARSRCALIYDDIPIEEVLQKKDELIKTMDVAIFRKAKNPAAQYKMLEAAGFTKFAVIKDSALIIK